MDPDWRGKEGEREGGRVEGIKGGRERVRKKWDRAKRWTYIHDSYTHIHTCRQVSQGTQAIQGNQENQGN